jgi:hypothetical protein
MAKKPEPPPKPINWKVYKIASKLVWLGDVEAPDESRLTSSGRQVQSRYYRRG